MTPEQYDELLAEIRSTRRLLDLAIRQVRAEQGHLDHLLSQLDQEESRIAHEALHSTHSASRKLVIHE